MLPLDPRSFQKLCWPHVHFYRQQWDIIYSVQENDETFVVAGNGLGKDFVSAFIALWFFCSRRPARVVTTSVKYDQLNDVLWGEIRRFIESSKVALPIQYNHMYIRQVRNDQSFVPLCELVGQVVSKGESLLGRHLPQDIPRTLAIFDEASGIDSASFESADTWAHRKLVIGNPFPCNNFFYTGVKSGNIVSPSDPDRYYRKVIKIRAVDSPNVRLAESELRAGKKPSHRILVPGLVDYRTYINRRQLWDKVRQTISLDAEFYEGAETLFFPPEWLNAAEQYSKKLRAKRKGKTLGIDPGEGSANTAFAICDEDGLIHLRSEKTPDTSKIPGLTLALMREFSIDPKDVLFDLGGGGKQHADILRGMGYPVRTVAFGAPASAEKKRSVTTFEQRKQSDEVRYTYLNRRAEMYGLLRARLDPATGRPFGLPAEYTELRRQLSPIPLLYDGEGRIYLPPKDRREGSTSKQMTLCELLGCSPDEADAVVLAVYGMERKVVKTAVGAL